MNIQDILKVVSYDPNTGIFTRVSVPPENTRLLGKPAGFISSKGYVRVTVLGKEYLGHRLAWEIINGKPPREHIDHINGVKNDNRICNLRECTVRENQYNTGKTCKNTSGYKGVSYNKKSNKYHAQAKFKKETISIGYFVTAEEASEAYIKFAKEHHGEFYRGD